ncbi:RNA polymerase sigma-70 factor, ECF subfamily [Filimonas lacunae]|uniref:RNA polymerase sigma-70 factor, ECF subfamily n=1 Tax=Filimonas lacunae TaxID=477680 RepID=A0A173MDJ1_9BACT|nr:sigma-70 family RNA polymerase sigma factor [Filimonas lacunae]BAV05654.1 RNA polymerase ECF-type sigma factor [Filimonas lacunae]SIT29032.1 RNA polymerase sigma-70 factor, ECF subfamily [Filimonas lacunae]
MTSREKLFDRIYTSTRERLFAYVKKFVPDESGIKDIMQQCYIKLWINIDTIDTDEQMLPLLFSYAKNLMIDNIRKTATEKKHFLNLKLTQETVTSTEPQIWTAESVQQINKAIVQMPSRRRKIFLMRKEEGLTVTEIATKLNITPRAVRKHLSEAVDYLRNNLAGMDVVAILFLYQLPYTLPLLMD